MEYLAMFNPDDKTPKYQQIIRWVISGIESSRLKPGARLASIQQLAAEQQLSKVTISRAYLYLAKKGYIGSIKGKGFYVLGHAQKLRILLIFNKLSAYKRATYYGLMDVLKNKAIIDLQIHHYNLKLLDEIINENKGKYNFFVIMPHFSKNTTNEECLKVLEKIPGDQLLLLDKRLTGINLNCMSVYQDFEQDIYASLNSVADLLQKYQSIVFLFPENRDHPAEVITSVKKYCKSHHMKFRLVKEIDELVKATVYIAIEEEELGIIIKKIRKTDYVLGKDIGVVSFNETIMKELLDITVFTTDFTEMGRIAGRLLLSSDLKEVRNSFSVIRRSSL